jgi:glycosyltransferase involved in cell wall biosynthesis
MTDRSAAGAPAMRVALLAHFAYPTQARTAGHIGGVEKQTTMLARWLASRGHEVSMIVWREPAPMPASIDGVRVVPLCGRDEGLPGLRFFHPRWTGLWRALERADAQVYYQNCGEYVTGQVAMWCRLRRRAFVYSAASDADCDPALPLMPERRVRALYRLGVRWADRLVVQTGRQQRMLAAGFGREAAVIPMPCAEAPAPSRAAAGATILWLGRICRVKRPDRLLDVAQACPELRFVLAGPDDDDREYTQAIAARAAALPNVRMTGGVTPDEAARLLDDAICLCCTSDHEGFPNTFLEAWSRGRPVVSTWDPDDLIASHDLGVVAAGAEGLAAALRDLAAAPATWHRMSARGREYFNRTHAAAVTLPQFEQVLLDAAHGRGAPSGRVRVAAAGAGS